MITRNPWICTILALGLALPVSAQLWKGIPGDIDMLEKAAKTDPEQAAEYAWHLLEGQGGRKFDAKQIFALFEKASAQGSTLAHVGLSRCYTKGIGTTADMPRAWKLAEEAGKSNHPEAWKQMGYLTSEGLGVAKDKKKALELFTKSTEAGSIAGKVNRLVATGCAGESDRYSPYAEIAIRYGHLLAAANATYGYVFNRGNPDKYETNRKIIRLLEDRAALDHPDALRALAFVRRCQGDRDASWVLDLKAARTGVSDPVRQLVADVTQPTVPPASSYPYIPYHVTKRDEENLIWYSYQQGNRTSHAISHSARILANGLDGKPGDPAAAVRMLAKHLPGEKKEFHYYMSNHCVSLIGKPGHENAGKLAVAHATYAADQYPKAFGMLGYLLSGSVKGIETDLSRAHAAMRQVPESERTWREQLKKLDKMLSEEQHQAADEWVAKGYPTASGFVTEAAALLKDAGQLEGVHY